MKHEPCGHRLGNFTYLDVLAWASSKLLSSFPLRRVDCFPVTLAALRRQGPCRLRRGREQPTSVAEAAGRTRRSLLGPQRLSGERGGVYWGRRGCREARVELLVAEEAVWVAGPKGRRTARSQLDPENCGSAQDRGVFVPAVGTSVSPHTEVLGR